MKESEKTKRIHWRAFISFTLTLSCCVMIISGVVLYLSPQGGLARMTGWRFCGLGKDGWMAQHMTSCTVFLLAGLIHLYLNIQILWSYIHSRTAHGIRRKWELLAGLALVGFMVTGTLWKLPPWNYILDGSRHLQAYKQEAENPRKGRRHRKDIRETNSSGSNKALPHEEPERRGGQGLPASPR